MTQTKVQLELKLKEIMREEVFSVIDKDGKRHHMFIDTAKKKLYLIDIRGRRKSVVNSTETIVAIINGKSRHEILVVDTESGHHSVVIAHGWHLAEVSEDTEAE